MARPFSTPLQVPENNIRVVIFNSNQDEPTYLLDEIRQHGVTPVCLSPNEKSGGQTADLIIYRTSQLHREITALGNSLAAQPDTRRTRFVVIFSPKAPKGWEKSVADWKIDEVLSEDDPPQLFKLRLKNLMTVSVGMAQLLEAKEAAEAANRAKSLFLAKMSHELRTPLNGIMGMVELAEETPDEVRQREFLRIIKSSATALMTIVNDILDLSKIESGKFELEIHSFDLQTNLGEAIKLMTPKALEKGLQLRFDLSPTMPTKVIGDAGRLRQIVLNLINNAIKFTETGEVCLVVNMEERNGEEILAHFQVRDTGIGIPLEKQANVFQAFVQADNTVARQFGGTGLGLTISAQLVEMMHGRIWLESKVGEGTAVHFTAQIQADPKAKKDDITHLEGKKILLVDDMPGVQASVGAIMRSKKVHVTPSVLGRDAIHTARKEAETGHSFDLVLLDLGLPDIDGIEVARLFTEDPKLKSIPIIMFTGSERTSVVARSSDSGNIRAYLLKPIYPIELLNCIERVLAEEKRGIETIESNPLPFPRSDSVRATEATSAPSLSLPPLNPILTGYKILLAEDNRTNQMILLHQLRPLGHHVIAVETGSAALEKWRSEAFDLILMDVNMPNMDGMEATRKIRQFEHESLYSQRGHTPIIALTALALSGDEKMCLDSGMDGYLSKPITKEKLLNVIHEVMIKHKP